MLFPDLPIMEEATKDIQLQSQLQQTEFTVKPTGEVSVKGNPDPELIRQLLVSADYQQDQNRKHETTIKSQQQGVEMMIVGFWGATFLVVIISLFLSLNQRQQPHRSINNGEFLRGTSCR